MGITVIPVASGGNNNFVLLNPGATTFSGGSTLTVNFSSYNSLRIYFASQVGFSTTLTMRLNGDSSSKYGLMASTRLGSTAQFSYAEPDTATSIKLFTVGSTAGSSSVMAKINIDGANTSGVKDINVAAGGVLNNSTENAFIGGATYSGTSPITSISFIISANTYANGTIYVYGA